MPTGTGEGDSSPIDKINVALRNEDILTTIMLR